MSWSVWLFAQDGGDRGFDQSDGDGPVEGMGRDRGFGGRGFGGRGEFRRFDGGDFGGGEGRFRGGPGSWGGGEGRWGEPGSEENRSPAQSASESAPTAPTSMRPRERVSIVLPEAYAEGDRDKDGQIGLYEWRQWRRNDMASFLALDHNGDGFLTPAELVKGPRSFGTTVSSVASANGSPSAIPVSSGSATVPVSTSSSSAGESSGESSPNMGAAAGRFGLLDANRNGQIDPEEWSRSRNIKSLFEGAKIDLSKPISKDDFIKHYLALNPGK